MNNNIYETVVIITPVLSDHQVKETTKEYEEYLLNNYGNLNHQEYWGLKRLAYPIQKKQSGWYCLFEYSFNPKLISKFELKLKHDERIMRFLTIRLDKEALKYSERRRNKIKKDKEKRNI